MYFRNYRLWKTWLEHFLKGAISEHALTVNMGKHCKHFQNLDGRTFFHVFSSFSQDLICKMSPLALGEILAVFVSTLTEHAKYSVQDCENLTLQIQIELSEKQKIFSQI